MAERIQHGLKPPADLDEHLERLRAAHIAGDVLALFQALDFLSDRSCAMPTWVVKPLEDTMMGVLTLRQGMPGRGNSPFGDLRKAFVRTVRASAYRYVRAWQRDPHRCGDLPNKILDKWYKGEIIWSSMRSYSDAARLAAKGLKGTEFQANASTVRKAPNKFPTPIRWGRTAVEERFQLRGPNGVFGTAQLSQPNHVKALLLKRMPKFPD